MFQKVGSRGKVSLKEAGHKESQPCGGSPSYTKSNLQQDGPGQEEGGEEQSP